VDDKGYSAIPLTPELSVELIANTEARIARKQKPQPDPDLEPDWSGKCEVCGASPIIPATGLCGPCSFGEADTADGNW
jgi:hypothetical protein